MNTVPPNLVPPPDLEQRVVARLEREGLIQSELKKEIDVKRIHLTWAIAATVLLVVGMFIGRMPAAGVSQAPKTADSRHEYALMLYEDATFQPGPASAMPDRVAEYTAWARGLAKDGTVVGGEKLSDSGVLLGASEPSAARVPSSEIGALAGYFVIRAKDEADAMRIASTCPHLKYGGRISLRRIET